jgi:hypothetical protein
MTDAFERLRHLVRTTIPDQKPVVPMTEAAKEMLELERAFNTLWPDVRYSQRDRDLFVRAANAFRSAASAPSQAGEGLKSSDGELPLVETRGGTGDDCSVGKRGVWPHHDGQVCAQRGTSNPEPDVTARRDGTLSPTPAQAIVAGGVRRWRHKKRGSVYTEVGRGLLQTQDAGGLTDNEPMVVYRNEETGALWIRDVTEFEDGRFEALPAPEGTGG